MSSTDGIEVAGKEGAARGKVFLNVIKGVLFSRINLFKKDLIVRVKMQLFWVIFLFYLMICIVNIACIEPITTYGLITGGSAALAAFGFNYETIKLNTYCRWFECCTPEYIPMNMKCKSFCILMTDCIQLG